jgi:RNA polymerase sigma-70 factor (ECF subfamily)
VFARVYERLASLRDDEAIRPWIAQLTRRLCIDALRGASHEESAEPVESFGEDDEALTEIEDAAAVHEAMARLPDECQEILDRFFARDESYRTIGEELDLAPGTVASRISRCLAKLRESLEGRKATPAPSGEQVTR